MHFIVYTKACENLLSNSSKNGPLAQNTEAFLINVPQPCFAPILACNLFVYSCLCVILSWLSLPLKLKQSKDIRETDKHEY